MNKNQEKIEWKKVFGRRLGARMDELKISQCELSRRSGVPQMNISVYVNGKVIPSVYMLSKLAVGLQIAPSELIDFVIM